MPELMPLTIEVDFVRGGQVVFSATTWAGYIGILTGVRPGGFSVSVNYRRSEVANEQPLKAFAKNLQRGLACHWPISFLVRAALDSCGAYEEAVTMLQTEGLIAPTYLTICGVKTREGCVLSRDREGCTGGSCVAGRLGSKPLVQANMDCWRSDRSAAGTDDDWQDICESRRRRAFALKALDDGSGGEVPGKAMQDLWLLMSLKPTLAHDTVYTVAMIPATGELVTRVKVTEGQKRAARRRYGKIRVTRKEMGTLAGGGGATRQ